MAVLVTVPATAASWFEGGQADAKGLCFVREYTDAHLGSHPAQVTRSARLFARSGAVTLAVTGRQDGDRVTAQASCDWSAQAGRDVNGRIIVHGHGGGPGYDCIVTGGPASAAEEGYLLIVPSAVDQSVRVYVQDDIGVRSDLSARLVRRRMGADDRVFQLSAAPPTACGKAR